ncbi:Gp138 family membrane-puncturing spike protein [Yokenella regensburgei]|uniref:Gp138 family membrane-puncturing spike protein n=1 Tax=Yokenella regensburgei TaxID=158877 RepID=UPI0013761666|nr:Gp138 family membrane-puncturing spike protein [Yokenella regensburgei]KAF1368537.1 hypothetical protein FHR25_002742 [Yokenella regensburgei]
MPVPIQSQIGGEQQAMSALEDSIKNSLKVALPGIIQTFDAETVTAQVQPAIKGYETAPDGSQKSLLMPVLVDVPVVFPRGGGCTLTFPVKAGDECLLVFADKCIDFWWQSGGVQEPVSGRTHHLGDAFAFVGPQSQAQKISGISTDAAQLRTDDGTAFVEVAAGGNVAVQTSGTLTANAEGGTTITSPEITLNGNVTINGNLSQGMGDSGGTATMQGPITVTHDVTAGGKSLTTHTHGGVQTGGGNTGAPN